MQQAALTDIFSRKYWKGQSNWYWSLGIKSTKSIANLRYAERMIPIQLRRVQKVILNWIHHFCTEKHCNAVTLCKGDLLELHALLYQQGRAITAPGPWVKGCEDCRGTRYHPGTWAEQLEAGGVHPCKPPCSYKYSLPVPQSDCSWLACTDPSYPCFMQVALGIWETTSLIFLLGSAHLIIGF